MTSKTSFICRCNNGCETITSNQHYNVRYIKDDMREEFTWQCFAESEEDAKRYFWLRHNSMEHEIIYVTPSATCVQVEHESNKELKGFCSNMLTMFANWKKPKCDDAGTAIKKTMLLKPVPDEKMEEFMRDLSDQEMWNSGEFEKKWGAQTTVY